MVIYVLNIKLWGNFYVYNDILALLNPPSTQVSLTNGKSPDGTVQVSVAANETVDSSENAQTHIMIIHEDTGDNEDGNTYTTQIISSEVSYNYIYIYVYILHRLCICVTETAALYYSGHIITLKNVEYCMLIFIQQLSLK